MPDLDDVSDSGSEDGSDCEDSDSEDESTHRQKSTFVLDVMDEDEDDCIDLEDELNEEEAAEVRNDAELLTFANLLQEAQATAVAAEWPKHYNRNSTCTQERIRQTRWNLEGWAKVHSAIHDSFEEDHRKPRVIKLGNQIQEAVKYRSECKSYNLNQLDQSLTDRSLKVNDFEHLQEEEASESDKNKEPSESGSENATEIPSTTPGQDVPDAPHITSKQHAQIQQLLDDL
jgi:hypothetical protein